MNLTKAALSNPAAALVAVVLLLLLGSVSLSQLPVQLFPNIDDPIITVQADWRAASPREVEAVAWRCGLASASPRRMLKNSSNKVVNKTVLNCCQKS